MKDYQNIKVSANDGVCIIKLDRAEKRNAINEQTMDELIDAFESISVDKSVRIAVLKASGDDFCAGADLDWMKDTQGMDEQEITTQNLKLQLCFQLWFDLPVFTISLIQGNVIGGGLGLVAASDMAVARPGARFRFSEVTLGLIPAMIAPFVIQRTGSRFIRNAMLTAEPFDSKTALQHGIIDRIADKAVLEDVVNELNELLIKVEPSAFAICKQLVNDINQNRITEPLDNYTSRLLAHVRKTDVAGQRIENFFKSLNRKNESE
jgi:methylglutaconyl-CoA hydratase